MDKNISEKDKTELLDFVRGSDWFTNGPNVKRFEKRWSNWLGTENSLMVNSGASANYLTIAMLKELRGLGEVIVPALGWSSDVTSLVQLGMKPVFVDIDPKTMGMDANELKKAISSDTVGVVIVHGLGFNALTTELVDALKEIDTFVIEDCCEAHGATIPVLESRKVGCFGDLSVFSFYFGHHMTTIEGGMLCSNSEELLQLGKMFRSHGMTRECDELTKSQYEKEYPDLNPDFTFGVAGFNFRSTELNAVLGLSQIERLDDNIAVRTSNLSRWLECLDGTKFQVDFSTDGSSNFALPLVLLEKDKSYFDAVTSTLARRGVEYRIGTAGGGNLARQPFLKKFKYRTVSNLDHVNHLHEFGLYIGNGAHVSKKMIDEICEELNAI
jgi:CDP-6-deoxy-D-xylo-4-hexulose-3-dehydrase